MRIAVVTDSGSGMTQIQGKDTNIFVLPLQVSVDGVNELEGETILVDDVYKHVRDNREIKTSLPPLARIEELFAKLKAENYDLIFAIPITTGLSSTIPTLNVVAEEIGIAFDWVDCYSTFSNQLYLAQCARMLFDDGREIEEVKEVLQKSAADSWTVIVPDDLDHLVKGGRLTPMAAKLGGFLKIKPILHLNKETDGHIDTFAKVRTMHKAELEIIEYLKKKNIDENYLLTVGHVADEEAGLEFLKLVKSNFPKCEILFQQIASVVGVHTGVGCIGLQYIHRIDSEH